MMKYMLLALLLPGLACAASFQNVFALMRDGKMEEVENLIHGFLEGGDVPASDLMYYQQGALWLSLGMQDHHRALNLVQVGIDRCGQLERQGQPGMLMTRWGLVRVKAQVLARMGKLDDAKAAADEVSAALQGAYEKPGAAGDPWDSPMNVGQVVLLSHSALPVIRAAFELKGEEEAARHLDWVRAKLDLADLILDGLAKRPAIPGTEVARNRQIIAWSRAEALTYAGQAAPALAVLARFPPDPAPGAGAGEAYRGFPLMTRAQALARTGKRVEAYRDLETARALFHEAMAAGNIWTGPNEWMASWQRGKLLEEDGKATEAIAAYQEALACIRPLYDKLKSAYARREFLKESDQVYHRLVRLLLAQGRVDEALDRLEESHSKGLLDLMEDSLNQSKRSWSPGLHSKAREIKQKLLDLDRAPAAVPGASRSLTPAPDRQRAVRMQLMSDYEALLHAAQEALAPARPASPAKWRATLSGQGGARARLAANDRFRTVAFLVASDPCWALVCGSGKAQAFRLSATAKEIRKTARALRKAIVGHDDAWRAAARDLYHMVLEPAAPALAGATRLLVVPDGELWYVPFACLLRADGTALVESFDIGVLSNLTLAATLSDLPAAKPGMPGLRIFADPDGSLPSARKEGQEIAALAPGSELLVGPEATERRLKGDGAASGKVVHLATHGVLDAVNPLFSYLLLAPGGGEDGQLQISEVSTELDLTGTPLAVLSACNTAVGDVSGGNEMVCLQQAFHEAGVPAIVASLWEVSDEWTAVLMKGFYKELAAGATPARALAKTMRALAKAGTTYQDPYRWSAFQVYGLP